jgi:hypothetical protein
MEQAINLIVLPLTLCDSKSNLYRVELLFIIRYAYAAVTLYIYYKVAAMIFNLVSYGIKFLPEPPPEAPKQESEPLKKKNKIKK